MTKIYMLKHPDTLEIRYIGKTTQTLKKRLSGHITKSKYNRTTYVSKWIYSLLQQNKKPIIELLELCENWIEREQYYIANYPNLCNHSIGGDGGQLGNKLTKEHKLKISKALKGKKRPQEVIDKIANSNRGKKVSEATKEKLRQFYLGKKASIKSRIKKGKIVYQYSLSGEFLKEWYSLGIITETLGYLKANISSCCVGRLKTAYGFTWKFKNEDIV